MLDSNNKANILIIDDNVKNIQLAANILKDTGLYIIYYATSGEAGIEQLLTKDISLILLDINMPQMNGYETAQHIHMNSKTSHIPIIYLSANADADSINKGFENHGQDYITKPFNEHELLHRVRTHVELFLSRQELRSEVKESHVLLEQYKNAIDSSALVSKTNVKGIITYVNEPFCEISQYTKEELVGKSHHIIRHEDEPKTTFQDMWKTILDKRIWKGTIKNKAKDGSAYFVDAMIMPIMNQHDEIIEFISVRTDITKQINAKEEILDIQREVFSTLGEMGEVRSQETGDHVNRVALYSEVLARYYGMNEEDIVMMKMASPMHDIGKIAIADTILLKPGKLTDIEFEQMKKHANIGYEIFKNSNHKMLQMAASISHEHHEKWDGSGYPSGLKEDEISICGRITAVADVFDALSHDRVYKKAWPLEEVLEFMKKESGISFEPRLIDILLEHIDEILAIKSEYNQ